MGEESGCKTARSDSTKVHVRSPEIDQKEHVTISGKQWQLLKTLALTLLHQQFHQNWMKIDDLVSDFPSLQFGGMFHVFQMTDNTENIHF